MTIEEKAAYLKGLADGMKKTDDSDEGKLWKTLTSLLCDMANEIADLQAAGEDFADALDEVCDELEYLEEITCDLDFDGEDMWDKDESFLACDGDCDGCLCPCGDEEEDENED